MEVAAALDNFLGPYKLSHRSDSVHLLHDEIGPGHAISELAKKQDIDLIVMGTIARTGVVGALMGNTAEQVLERVNMLGPDYQAQRLHFAGDITRRDE